MEHQIDPELAIFGSSNGLTDFDAPLLQSLTGKTTYNLSMDGMPFEQNRVLMREFAANAPSCKEVVLAETFLTFRHLHAVSDPWEYVAWASQPDVYSSLYDIDPSLAWRLRHVPLYTFIVADHHLYRASAAGFLTLLGRPPRGLEDHGYLPSYAEWSPNDSPADDDVSPNERIGREYAEVLESFNANHKRVIVVITPVQEVCLGKVPWFDSVRDALARLVAKNPINRLLDYTHSEVARSTKNSYNCGHLNFRGADAFTRQFAEDLSRLESAE
jgi:hypothetical protein